MPPIDNIGSFSGFPQSVPSSAAEASSSAGASEGAGRARTDTEFLALWDEWERNAPQGGGEQRGIAVERLQDCLKRNAIELDLSRLSLASLPELPPHIEVLWAPSNSLSELPPLPASLRRLSVYGNQLITLPTLPASLKNLSAFDNELSALPSLPASLENLSVQCNQLSTLPTLPPSLKGLDASDNWLNELPTLPPSLEELFVRDNRLNALPTLPPFLTNLIVTNNQLTSLPDELPGSLRLIVCEDNRLTQLPESISRLPNTGRIFAESNPFSVRTIQALQNLRGDPGYHGPTVYFSMQVNASRPARPLEEAVAAWLPSESEANTAGRWEAIAKEDGAPAFSAFLDRLQDTISAQKVPGFKEQVAAWLTSLSETPALREKTFLVSVGATESCQDRVALTWNNMQKAELEHRIACGACDQNLPEVVSAGREMFRLEQLDQIAREKAGTLRFVDEIEVHLAFQTKLRDSLGLSSATREMFFYNVSGVTQDDLKAAELRVKTAEDSTFSDWFCLWTPWHAVLQRIAPEGWGQAATIRLKSHETDYQSRVEAELRALDLEGDLDAERTMGKKVMTEIDLEAFGPLTKAVLAGRNQTELLDSQWKI